MEITYANSKVRKYFEDYSKMQRKLPFEWVRTVKKHMDRLRAAECFEDFLRLGLGKPEQLEGYQQIRYSLHVAPHARLIIEPNATQDRNRSGRSERLPWRKRKLVYPMI